MLLKKSFLFLLIFAILLTGCKNSFSDYGKNDSSGSKNVSKVSEERQAASHINPNVPQFILYNGNNITAWVNQYIFTDNGEIKEQSSYGDRTYVKLNYLKDGIIKTVDLTEYALQYNLFNGVEYITASSKGKYIVVQFSSDLPISIIVDTNADESKILWYNEAKHESMMSISFNPGNEEEFAFLPSADIKGPDGSHTLKTYNLTNNLIKTIGEVKEEKISMSKALIKWDKDKIFVVTVDGKHLFSFTDK